MEQHVRDVPIIGHQDESGGFSIESADGKQAPDTPRQEVDDRPPALVIPHRRDDAARLVHDPVDRALTKQSLTVETDLIRTRIGAISKLRHTTVDRDPLLADETFDVAAGSETRTRQELLEPDRSIVGHSLCDRGLCLALDGPGRASRGLRPGGQLVGRLRAPARILSGLMSGRFAVGHRN